jgi:hypothetical protein
MEAGAAVVVIRGALFIVLMITGVSAFGRAALLVLGLAVMLTLCGGQYALSQSGDEAEGKKPCQEETHVAVTRMIYPLFQENWENRFCKRLAITSLQR